MPSDSEYSTRIQVGKTGRLTNISRTKRVPLRFREVDDEELDPDEQPAPLTDNKSGKEEEYDTDIDGSVSDTSVQAVPTTPKLTSSKNVVLLPPPLKNNFGLAAAIRRQFPNGFPAHTITTELQWQQKGGGDMASTKAFRTEALLSQGLLVFGFLQPTDTTISLLHSPATYHARGGSGSLTGKDIGFVGDRGEFTTPSTVLLHPERPWKWVPKLLHLNEAAIDEFYSVPTNYGKFYKPPASVGDEMSSELIPRLILLPQNLVEFCASHPRTPYEFLKKVNETSADGREGLTYANGHLLAKWCIAACHKDAGKQKLAYSLEIAHDNSIEYHEWVAARLAATLGPRQQVPAPTTQPHAASSGTQEQDLQKLSLVAAEIGKGMLQALRPQDPQEGGRFGLSTGIQTLRGDETGKVYDKFHYAVLQGFSHCHSIADLQPIWGLFAQTKSFDTHRLTIKDSMITWARRFNVTINRGIFFAKQTIDDFINLRFNPSGGVAYFATAEKGMSILLCRSRAGDEREQATAHEQAEGESSTNRTLAEALALGKRDPRPPPDTYHDLKAVIGTFCALLWTFFGDRCEYFNKCFELYNCLDSDTVSEKWHFFTPLLCRQIVWAILDDGREYFSQTMLPNKFEVSPSAAAFIRYPISSLEELIRPIRNQAPIIRANFPSQWLAKQDTRREHTQGSGSGNRIYGDIQPPITMVSHSSNSQPSPGQASTRSSVSSMTSAAAPNTGGRSVRQADMHPTIKAVMGPYMNRIGRLQITRIMALAETSWEEMPRIPKFVDNDTNNLCYNYVLGKCNPRFCHHKTGHAHVNEIPDEFANTLCTLLEPGLKDMTDVLAKMPWTEFKTFIAGRPAKRARQE